MGVEGCEDDNARLRARDGDVQTLFSTLADKGSPGQRYPSRRWVACERESEEDDVPLVSLHVLEVLHEQRLVVPGHRLGEGSVVLRGLFEQVEDQVTLLRVEGDDADALGGAFSNSRPDLADDSMGLGAVHTRTPRAAFPHAVDPTELKCRLACYWRRGEARQATLVVVLVREGDQRLVTGAVVPREEEAREVCLPGLRQDRLQVDGYGESFVGRCVDVVVDRRWRRREHRGRRHLLRVANDHHGL